MVPGLEIGADRALTLAAVVREAGGGHVGFVAFHLQVDHEGLHFQTFDRTDSAEHAAGPGDPITFCQSLAADEFGDLWHGRYAQVVGFGQALERDFRTILAARDVIVFPLTVLTGGRDAQTQQLVAQTFDQRFGCIGEVDFLAAADATVGFKPVSYTHLTLPTKA